MYLFILIYIIVGFMYLMKRSKEKKWDSEIEKSKEIARRIISVLCFVGSCIILFYWRSQVKPIEFNHGIYYSDVNSHLLVIGSMMIVLSILILLVRKKGQ